jgi:hypothetical protein
MRMNEKQKEIGKADERNDSTDRQEWQRPEVRRLDVGQAESFFNSGPDYGIVS